MGPRKQNSSQESWGEGNRNLSGHQAQIGARGRRTVAESPMAKQIELVIDV